MYEVDTSLMSSSVTETKIKSLIDILSQRKNMEKCCLTNMKFKTSGDKFVILKLSNTVQVNVGKSENVNGKRVTITSSINQTSEKGATSYPSIFNSS